MGPAQTRDTAAREHPIRKQSSVFHNNISHSPKSTTFDPYGVYFGVCGSVVEIYKARGGAKVAQLETKADYTEMRYVDEKERIGLDRKIGASLQERPTGYSRYLSNIPSISTNNQQITMQ